VDVMTAHPANQLRFNVLSAAGIVIKVGQVFQ